MSKSGPTLSPAEAHARGGSAAAEGQEAGLSGQIDALLAGMQDSAATLAADQTSQRVENHLKRGDESGGGVGGASGEAPLNSGEVESLASQIDALVSEVGAAAEPSQVGAAVLAELIEGRVATVDQPPPAASPEVKSGPRQGAMERSPEGEAARDASDDLRALDAQLAAQAKEPEPAPQVAAPPVAAVLPDLAASGRREAELAAEAAGLVAAAVSPAPAVMVPDEPRVSAGVRVFGVVAWVWRAIRSVCGLSLVLSARTLEASPKLARETMGWIGLVTVFFACCLWAIILFFRATPVPEVYGVASEVLEPGEPTPQGRPRPQAHTQDAAGSGEKAAPGEAAGGHGAPAGAPAAPAAAAGSGGH